MVDKMLNSNQIPFQSKKFTDLHKDVTWSDMVVDESNVMPRFLIVGDGVITSEPIWKLISESLFMLWEDAAMKN